MNLVISINVIYKIFIKLQYSNFLKINFNIKNISKIV